jgi:hypothetical protein
MKKISILVSSVFLLSCHQNRDTLQHTDPGNDSIVARTDTLPVAVLNRDDSATITVAQNRLIIPGKRIGLTSIGQKSEETARQLGKADDGDAAMGKSLGTWYSKSNRAYKTQVFSSISFGKDENIPRVKSIRINNPFFETANHLKAGNNLIEILQQFPAMLLAGYYETQAKKKVRIYDDSEAGIAFEIDDKDICVGICVHPAGEKAFSQYLPFENSFKVIEG